MSDHNIQSHYQIPSKMLKIDATTLESRRNVGLCLLILGLCLLIFKTKKKLYFFSLAMDDKFKLSII